MGNLKELSDLNFSVDLDPFLIGLLDKRSVSRENLILLQERKRLLDKKETYSIDIPKEHRNNLSISNRDLTTLFFFNKQSSTIVIIRSINKIFPSLPTLKFNPYQTDNKNPLSIFIPKQIIPSFSNAEQYLLSIKNDQNRIFTSEEPAIIQEESKFYSEEIELSTDIPSLKYHVFLNDLELGIVGGIDDGSSLFFTVEGKSLSKFPKSGYFWIIISTKRSIEPEEAIIDIKYLSDEWEDFYAVKLDANLNPILDGGPPPHFVKVVWDEKPILSLINDNDSNILSPVYNHIPVVDIQTDSPETSEATRILIDDTLVPLKSNSESNFSVSMITFFDQVLKNKGSKLYNIKVLNTLLSRWKEEKNVLILNGLEIQFCDLPADDCVYLPSQENPKVDIIFTYSEQIGISSTSLENQFYPNGYRFKGERKDICQFYLVQNNLNNERKKYVVSLQIPELTWKFKIYPNIWNRKQLLLNQDEYEQLDIYRNVEIKITQELIDSASIFFLQNPDEKNSRKLRNGIGKFSLGHIDFFIPQSNFHELDVVVEFLNRKNLEIISPLFKIQLWRIINWRCVPNKLDDNWELNITWEENFKTNSQRTIILWSKNQRIETRNLLQNEYQCTISVLSTQLKELNYYFIQYVRGGDFEVSPPDESRSNVFKFFNANPELESIVALLENENISDSDFISVITKLLELCVKDNKFISYWQLIIQELFISRNRLDFFIEKLCSYIGIGVTLSDVEFSILMSLISNPIIPFLLSNQLIITPSISYGLINIFININEKSPTVFSDTIEENPNDPLLIFFLSCEEFLHIYTNSDVWTPFASDTTEKDQQMCIRKLSQCIEKESQIKCLEAIREILINQKKIGHTINTDELMYYFIILYLYNKKVLLNDSQEKDKSIIKGVLTLINEQKTENKLIFSLLKAIPNFDSNKAFSNYSDELTRECAKTLESLKEIFEETK